MILLRRSHRIRGRVLVWPTTVVFRSGPSAPSCPLYPPLPPLSPLYPVSSSTMQTQCARSETDTEDRHRGEPSTVHAADWGRGVTVQ
eukprot:4393731-Prymnesium_polylepis.1